MRRRRIERLAVYTVLRKIVAVRKRIVLQTRPSKSYFEKLDIVFNFISSQHTHPQGLPLQRTTHCATGPLPGCCAERTGFCVCRVSLGEQQFAIFLLKRPLPSADETTFSRGRRVRVFDSVQHLPSHPKHCLREASCVLQSALL